MRDFTSLLELALDDLGYAESAEREDCAPDGESGSVIIEMEDGRKFRVSYSRA
jgi:hypothetical protein